MPIYTFEVKDVGAEDTMELPDDNAAWSEIVTWCGDLLKDLDGTLSPDTDMKLCVSEGDRPVGQIRVIASRTLP